MSPGRKFKKRRENLQQGRIFTDAVTEMCFQFDRVSQKAGEDVTSGAHFGTGPRTSAANQFVAQTNAGESSPRHSTQGSSW